MDRFGSIYPAVLTKRLPPAPPPGGADASKENLAGKVNVRKTTPAPKTKSQWGGFDMRANIAALANVHVKSLNPTETY